MSTNHATSLDPEGPRLNIKGENFSMGAAVLADVLQLLSLVSQTSPQIRTFLFLLALLTGGGLMLWVTYKWPKARLPIAVFVAGTLVALLLLFWSTSGIAKTEVVIGGSSAPTYYIKVFTFPDDASDGEIQTQHPLSEITIMTRDRYGHTATYKTSTSGTQTIPIASVPPESFALVTVGACGVFQMHHISENATSPATAQTIQIGIDAAHAPACHP